jgi:hypothetical protein
MHLLQAGREAIVIDAGLFHGHRDEFYEVKEKGVRVIFKKGVRVIFLD